MDAEFKKMLGSKRCFIFDLDGTIADTEKIQWEAHNSILKKEYGIEVDLNHIYSYLGKPESIFLKEIEQDYNIDIGGKNGKGYAKYIKKRNKLAEKLILSNSKPFPFIKEILNDTFGIQIVLISAQNKSLIRKCLSFWGLAGTFQEANTFVVEGDKTKPYYYDYVMNNILKNASPSEIILFEDVNKYLDEGNKRGFVTVGIKNSFSSNEIHANYVIDSTKEKLTIEKK